jgi:hypothetical protein
MDEDKIVKFSVSLPESERKAFKALCAENGTNMSAQVVEWIAEANAKRKRGQNK